MSKIKYTKAPISELIFGIVFKTPVLMNSGVMFPIVNNLIQLGYSDISTLPAILEEEFIDGKLVISADHNQTGFSITRLQNKDQNTLIQIQGNALLFNWIRKDEMPVGNYPGFAKLLADLEKVFAICSDLYRKQVGGNEGLENSIKRLALTYQDRIPWQENVSIDQVVNIALPSIDINGAKHKANHIAAKFAINLPVNNDFFTVAVSTAVDHYGQNILVVESKLKGSKVNATIGEWYSTAHQAQLNFFESYFTEEQKKLWL